MNSDFLPRVLSAVILAPLAIWAVWTGGILFAILVGLIAAVIYWEWIMMTAGRMDLPRDALMIAGLFATIVLTQALCAQPHLLMLALTVTCTGAVFTWSKVQNGWRLLGIAVSLLLPASLIHLLSTPQAGVFSIVFLFVCVWGADTCAYLVGRTVGGPKLWPSVSPKKTWSGFVGAHVGAALLVSLFFGSFDGWNFVAHGLLAVVLAFAAQSGDLIESSLKRRFNVKDTSNLIPGHGGVLDRVDGLILASLVLCALVCVFPSVFSSVSLPAWMAG